MKQKVGDNMKNEISEISFETIGRFAAIPHTFIKGARHLSLRARWLFVALMSYRNSQSGWAFPSYDELCELTGMSRNAISKAVRELEDERQEWVWLTRKKRFGSSTLYWLNLPHPDDEVPF